MPTTNIRSAPWSDVPALRFRHCSPEPSKGPAWQLDMWINDMAQCLSGYTDSLPSKRIDMYIYIYTYISYILYAVCIYKFRCCCKIRWVQRHVLLRVQQLFVCHLLGGYPKAWKFATYLPITGSTLELFWQRKQLLIWAPGTRNQFIKGQVPTSIRINLVEDLEPSDKMDAYLTVGNAYKCLCLIDVATQCSLWESSDGRSTSYTLYITSHKHS